MNTLKEKETELMLEEGFFVVETECCEYLNICLDSRVDGNGGKKSITGDGGFNWGTCGTANESAIEKYGYESVLEFLLKSARSAGIKTK